MSDRVVTFLLVDDLEENLIALEALLQGDGLHLIKARSGREALELLLVHEVSLAILDVQMPEMDGFELAELMRGTERTRRVPIIFVTAGLQDNQRRFRGYELGAVDFLFKPIAPHILKSKSEIFLDLARQRNELQQAKEQLTRTNEDLERKVQERTSKLRDTVAELEHFSYTITHDMRAPLRAMRGLSSILIEECAECLDPQRQDFLRRIAESAERMDQLITDALQYSLLVRGQFELEKVDSGELLRGMLKSYPQFHAPQADIRVRGELPVVVANRAGLTQCFSNLLGNALKFVHPGKKPEVRIWAETVSRGEVPPAIDASDGMGPRKMLCEVGDQTALARERVETKSQKPAGFVRIWFQDRGIGIEPKFRDKIWDMFQRLSSSYEGTGIGLALVRKAVERMGGRVGVESEPGQGSRFWVELASAPADQNG